MAAAKRSGYLDVVPPPPGGQAGLDAYARALIKLDAAARPGPIIPRHGRPAGRGKRKRR
jgi:hypothetical protein